ncbi:MAG: DNA translocase FtsK [candidate division KSB1 bacterium]|nr:DNA translocase FtsK [candidate division KSB1 bacterium]
MTKRRKRRLVQKSPRRTAAAMSPEKEQEIMGILLIVFSILLFAALYSYSPEETPASIFEGHRISNLAGWAGVYLSHFLIRYTLGYATIVLPFLIFFWGWNRLLHKDSYPLIRWTFYTLLFALYVSIAFALVDGISSAASGSSRIEFSGLLGSWIAKGMIVVLGPIGAVIFLIGAVILTVLFISTLRLSDILLPFEDFFRKLANLHYVGRPKQATRKIKEEVHKDQGVPFRRQQLQIHRSDLERPPQVSVKPLEELREEEAEEPPEEAPRAEARLDYKEQLSYLQNYRKPPLELLTLPQSRSRGLSEDDYRANARLLEEKLEDFGIQAQVVEIHPGPVITLYELELAPGIRLSRVVSLADDIAMAMRAQRIRVVAPIPGKSTIGIEIPNPEPEIVYLREVIDTPEFRAAASPLTMPLGKTIFGKPYYADLAKMPHLLIAGSTGSGKSVCLNTIIAGILYKSTPAETQLVLIDPKRLELSAYAKLYRHHLNYVEGAKQKVATNAKSAIQVLKSVELEMERRYSLLAAAGVRNIDEYNQRIRDGLYAPSGQDQPLPLPYLVLIVDELADLMLTANASGEVEEPIARLTQMSRAVGIHLILATQRPSVDVITGVIKANFPARIAFQVPTKVDSRTILDMNGAEKLLGRGDMLFLPPGSAEPIRLHNAYISLEEIEQLIEFVRHQPEFNKAPLAAYQEEEEGAEYSLEGGDRDPLFEEAMKIVVLSGQGSVSILQRKLKVGYSRAARLIDQLEEAGVVGPFEGSKAREVLMTPADLEAMNFKDETEDEEL